ncbi:phage tail tape measure protein [Virgibacillus salexigens]|uniref:phage tail tape measure protein n=1 Tax=Virgibacillus salexigens TaxID=61016 RepID=UPI00190BD986|nr:phage tail tape measure protein [Virgibacillus salexigens]
MAIGGTPVGNMIIKVDLDSAGVEKSMTGLQRQLKSSNKAMGAQLSAFDRGEKSTKKYGVLIEGLTNRHRIQAKMVEEARKKYNNLKEANKENTVAGQKASQELNEQISLYQETGRELDNVTADFQEFQRVQDMQSKGWYKVADGMENYGGKLKAAGQTMDNTGQQLTRNVTLPLGIAGGVAIKTGMDFEAGMSKVGAVSGASADEMQKLEAKARDMGASTVFSAKEASDAFYYMSLAGWDATDMMDGISGVMDLAAASGEDLASVSDIVTDGLTAFGESAKESSRMADILAAASSNANTDVAGLGNAFKYVAPVAGALGYTMEDTSKAIGIMANAGVKGEKAGTALRTMMTNLSKPTKAMKEAMDEYNISLTDSNGEMKSFDDVMKDLRKNLGKLDKKQQASAAATIFGKEAMSGALAVVNASESDYEDLTKAIEGSEGAAGEMADTMQDNLAGSLKELRSKLEDLFITTYKNLQPSLESLIENAKDLTDWFASLSPKTQENIIKFGLLSAAAGPVLSIFGKLTFGTGALMQGMGSLTKTIGNKGGKGTLGAIAGLSRGGAVGLAIAGVAGLSVGVYKLIEKSKEAEEVNLDVAKSLNDQASELDNSAETFDKLSEKAKISNDQLAKLNDLNIRISESSNPGEINELQKQYEELAKKSGLSKDELQDLFDANKDIVDQAPGVQTSVSETGNAFAKNTDAVNEFIDSLYNASRAEIEAERIKQLKQEEEIRNTLNEKQEVYNFKNKELEEMLKLQNISRQEALDRQWEINAALEDETLSEEKKKELRAERNAIDEKLSGKLDERITKQNEEVKKQRESLNTTKEELKEVQALDLAMANIVLKQAGINEEGEKGLVQLDKSIAKNNEEILKLEEKRLKSGQLTAEEQKRYDELVKTNGKQQEAKNYLFEELGIYRNINSLLEGKLTQLSKEKQKKIENLAKTTEIKVEEGNIVQQLQKKNDEHLKERENLIKNLEKQGANKQEIRNQISELDKKILKNDDVLIQILQEAGLWDQVKDEVNLGKNAIAKQGDQIDNNNKKTDQGIQKEKERTKEASKDVDKSVYVTDNGTVDFLNKHAGKLITKSVNATDNGTIDDLEEKAKSPVRKTIEFIASGFKWWAKGTPPSGHPGGHAVVGDGGGRELIQIPSGATFLSPSTDTLLPDLPKGSHVIPHRETERLMKSAPKYASGTKDWQSLLSPERLRGNEFMKLLALNGKNNESNTNVTKLSQTNGQDHTKELLDKLSEQVNDTKEIVSLLTQILLKDTDVYIDGRTAGTLLEKYITEIQNRNKRRRDSFA